MRALAIGSFVGSFIGSVSAALFFPATSYASPYATPPGYHRTPESFQGDVFAVAPNGEVAIGFQSDPTIRVYASAAAAQANATPIQSFTPVVGGKNAKFWGDLTFADNNTLLMSEDKNINGVLSGTVGGIHAGDLSFLGSVPSVQGVAVHNGNVYAVTVNGPGANAVYQVGNPTPILSGIGNGYLGGIAFDSAGRMFLTDSNDSGPAGQIIRYDPTLTTATTIDLSGGNGFGAFDVALDTEGDIFATTGITVTEVPVATGLAKQFGSAFSDSPAFGFTFVSALDFGGTGFTSASDTGRLWINAVDTEDSAIIGVQTPEPSGALLLLVAASAFLLRRRLTQGASSNSVARAPRPCSPPHSNRTGKAPVPSKTISVQRDIAPFAARTLLAQTFPIALVVVAMSLAPGSARADQFFATQVISTAVGTAQGSFHNPALALGGPRGGGIDSGSTDVYSLGNGGSITFGFDDSNPTSHRYITDGPGPDFIVSENAFDQADDPHQAFAELMFVEVSSDGTNFQRFPNFSATPDPIAGGGVLDPDNLAGFAGVNPVLADVGDASNASNGINPFQVGAAGGDVFDLHSLSTTPLVQNGVVDLQHIRYLRLVDVIGNGTVADSFGRPIYDPVGTFVNGADVDSVAVVNGAHAPEPSLGLSVALLALIRRGRP